jgi:hypothetical protein
MRRARIESLEERKMFSVTDLIIDPFSAAVSATIDESTAIVDFIDPDEVSTPFALGARTESVGKDESISIGAERTESVATGDVNSDLLVGTDGGVWRDKITHSYDGDLAIGLVGDFNGDKEQAKAQIELMGTFNIVGDFNGDGVDDLATFIVDSRPEVAALKAGRNQDIEVENDESHWLRGGDEVQLSGVVAGNLIGVDRTQAASAFSNLGPGTFSAAKRGPDLEEISFIRDGQPVQAMVDSMLSDDLIGWSNLQGVSNVGDGTMSAYSGYSGGGYHALVCFRAPRDIDGLPLGQESHYTPQQEMEDIIEGPPMLRSNVSASLLGSDEYFSRFANTTLDDQAAAVSVLLGTGDGTFSATHNAQFDTAADMSRYDRGHLPVTLVEVLVAARARTPQR